MQQHKDHEQGADGQKTIAARGRDDDDDTSPLGEQPMRMMPAAISGGRPLSFALSETTRNPAIAKGPAEAR
ncbi:MAG TPA: hypothetical protein VGN00_29560 [Puia sp.]